MLFDFASALVFLLFGVIFVFVSITIARLLAPRAPSPEKETPYECGELPVGTPWIRFNPRYYLFALIFLVFDVEIAFMFPCAVVFRDWIDRGVGKVAFLEIAAFVGILIVGLAYVWRKGDLTWVKTISPDQGKG
ncbi:MAG: NADH-quinone oxidoreductase subunit A [Pseudomonadota bacterium]